MEQVGWSFACGSAVRSDGMFFARERDDLTAQGVIATSFYIWNEQNPDPAARWSIYSEVANWRALGMASVKVGSAPRVTVALGSKGQYFELEPAVPTQYLGAIPDLDVLVRRVVAVEEVIFAVGMGRSVIRRVDRGNWIEFGPGTTDADRDQIVGFEEIDGNVPTICTLLDGAGRSGTGRGAHGDRSTVLQTPISTPSHATPKGRSSPSATMAAWCAARATFGTSSTLGALRTFRTSPLSRARSLWSPTTASCCSGLLAWLKKTASWPGTDRGPVCTCCRRRTEAVSYRWAPRISLHFLAGSGGGSSRCRSASASLAPVGQRCGPGRECKLVSRCAPLALEAAFPDIL